MSFIFADLIIIPILLIYRKYYGTKAALLIFGVFYLAMAAAGYIIELLFTPLGLVPHQRRAAVLDSSISWNYTTWLNIVFLVIAAVLVFWFYRSGSGPMLRAMGGGPDSEHEHHHDHSSTHEGHEHASNAARGGHGQHEP
jgi:uncharacterized membrane protein YraQ (UPF0718 family)